MDDAGMTKGDPGSSWVLRRSHRESDGNPPGGACPARRIGGSLSDYCQTTSTMFELIFLVVVCPFSLIDHDPLIANVHVPASFLATERVRLVAPGISTASATPFCVRYIVSEKPDTSYHQRTKNTSYNTTTKKT